MKNQTSTAFLSYLSMFSTREEKTLDHRNEIYRKKKTKTIP